MRVALAAPPPPLALSALHRGSAVRAAGLAAPLSAGLLLLAGPPHDIWPLALVALVPVLLVARRLGPGGAALLGLGCGALVNLGAFWWSTTLLRDFAGLSAPAASAACLALCVCQGLVFGVWLSAARLLDLWRVPWVLSAPLAVVVAESTIRFVFEWYLGVVLWRAWPLAQLAELGGPSALSALVVLINVLVTERVAAGRGVALSLATRRAALVCAVLVLAGAARAAHVAWLRARAPAVEVGLVQPNIGIVSAEQRAAHGEAQLRELVSATELLGRQGASLVVWPETAFPFLVDRGLTREFPQGHPWNLRGSYEGALLFGALTHDFDGSSSAYNSAVLVSPRGALTGLYDKRRLLAFGEYVPLASRFPEWAARTAKHLPPMPALRPGTRPPVLAAPQPDATLGIFICYEDLEAGAGAAQAAAGAQLLVTLANHAWFEAGPAAAQARALAVLRGIEARRDFIRATSTGVSTVSDAIGRVHGELRAGTQTQVLRATVARVDAFTLGAFTIRPFPFACGAGLALAALGFGWRRRTPLSRQAGRTPCSRD